MNPISESTLRDALQWRYATKKFDSTKSIPAATWEVLLDALVLSPSSFGAQPWNFVIVEDPAKRAELVGASWGQSPPASAAKFVVFTRPLTYTDADVDAYVARTADVRSTTPEALKPFGDVIKSFVKRQTTAGLIDDWMARQSYIALGQLMASAAVLGVDALPMEGIDPVKYDEILGLKARGLTTIMACAVGYRAVDDKYAAAPKVRFPREQVVTFI